MKTIHLGLLAAFAVGFAGCAADAGGPPRIELDRTACAHCGMLVSEAVFAAAYRTGDAPARIFDDIGCLVAERRRQPAGDRTETWVHDVGSGAWLAADRAVFVRSAAVRTPMNGGVLAFGDTAAAERAARQYGGDLVRSFDALVGRAGKDGVQ